MLQQLGGMGNIMQMVKGLSDGGGLGNLGGGAGMEEMMAKMMGGGGMPGMP